MNPDFYDQFDDIVDQLVEYLLYMVDEDVTKEVVMELVMRGFLSDSLIVRLAAQVKSQDRFADLPAVPCDHVERMITEAQAFANNAGGAS